MRDETVENVIEALADVPGRLEALTAQVMSEESPTETWTPSIAGGTAGEGEWTASEIVGHLCDAARIYGGRMRRIVYENDPHLASYDEQEHVAYGGYRFKPLGPLVRQFRELSGGTVTFLRSLPETAWQRTGEHEEAGRVTLREMVQTEADHEHLHLRQLADVLRVPSA